LASSSDLKKGAAVAQIAFLVVLGTGLAEIFASFFAGSVALLADGIHSVATAAIDRLVWFTFV
jgi:divalent metal cation (Fe/Co/Zn/Cd) transporter